MMRSEIAEIMKRHNVERFNFYRKDLFTYVLETDKPASNDLLLDLSHEVQELIYIETKVMPEPSNFVSEIAQAEVRNV